MNLRSACGKLPGAVAFRSLYSENPTQRQISNNCFKEQSFPEKLEFSSSTVILQLIALLSVVIKYLRYVQDFVDSGNKGRKNKRKNKREKSHGCFLTKFDLVGR